MKINWIEIDNIKSFGKPTRVILNEDYNFVVGTNGSGKTTLLQTLCTCLFTIYPHYTTGIANSGIPNEKRVALSLNNRNIVLPKSYGRELEPQNVSIEITFEDSIPKLIKELNSLKEIFELNKDYILSTFIEGEILEYLPEFIRKLITLKEKTYIFHFEGIEKDLELKAESMDKNKDILDILKNLEKFRIIYNRLFRERKTEKFVSSGFKLVYISSDRIPYFTSEIYLGRQNKNEYLNNSSYNKYADTSSMIFANGSVDYINQILSRISEKIVYQKWEKLSIDPLKQIDEFIHLKKNIKNILDLEFIAEIPGSPYESMHFSFQRNGKQIDFENLSSGEKSLVYFLFTFSNPDIKNSFILIDEAEIHLHGDMQDKLLEIIFNQKYNNQYFVSTHSPKLINDKTISSVIRFYKSKNITKYINFKIDVSQKSFYDIIRLINSQNNEKMFFADKVVLVEGIKDRIFYEKVFKQISKDFKLRSLIEVIDVGGKMNLSFYKRYLDEIKLENYIFADLDYLINLKGSELKDMLITDTKKLNKQLKEKKSKDRIGLIQSLEDFVIEKDEQKLEDLIEYLKSRAKIFRNDLSQKEIYLIDDLIKKLIEEKIYIISSSYLAEPTRYKGEIEDYLIGMCKSKNNDNDINELVKALSKEDFLKEIVSKIPENSLHELFQNVASVLFNNTKKSANIIDRYRK